MKFAFRGIWPAVGFARVPDGTFMKPAAGEELTRSARSKILQCLPGDVKCSDARTRWYRNQADRCKAFGIFLNIAASEVRLRKLAYRWVCVGFHFRQIYSKQDIQCKSHTIRTNVEKDLSERSNNMIYNYISVYSLANEPSGSILKKR